VDRHGQTLTVRPPRLHEDTRVIVAPDLDAVASIIF
jgi:hypothetical protein